MAKTQLQNYTVQEKLNKMDVDLISVTPTVSTGSTDADADLLFDSLEIENAVAVNGGASILQSVSVYHKGDQNEAFDLLFFQVTKDLGTAGAALTWGGSSETTNADNAVLMGHVSVSNWSDLVDVQIGTKTNIGLVLKAASGTTSIYCAGVCRGAASGDHSDGANIDIRLGFVKD